MQDKNMKSRTFLNASSNQLQNTVERTSLSNSIPNSIHKEDKIYWNTFYNKQGTYMFLKTLIHGKKKVCADKQVLYCKDDHFPSISA